MVDIKIAILAVYLSLIIVTGILSLIDGINDFYKTPKEIYENTEMNMFGCLVVWIFSTIFNPLRFVFLFIYFLFHVGRKHDDEEDEYFGI